MLSFKTVINLRNHFSLKHPKERCELSMAIYGRIVTKNEDPTASEVHVSQEEIALNQSGVFLRDFLKMNM